MSQNRSRPWFPAVAAALASLLLYAVTLGAAYNIYDDGFLVSGPDIRVRNPHLWGQFWKNDFFHGGIDNLYRPLASQSFGLQWWLTGNRPWPFHLVNILLSAGVCAAVAELGRRLAGWRAGLIAGLLFAVHPVHVEAVTSIVGRTELLCALGLISALVIFLRPPLTLSRAIAITALGLMAMLSKEPGMLLPVLLIGALPVRGPLAKSERTAAKWLAVLVLWSVSALIILREQILGLKFEWDRSFLDWTIQPLIHSPPADRWLIPIALVGRYARLLIFPTHLSIDYGAAIINPTIPRDDPYLWFGVFCLIAAGVTAIVLLRKKNWPALFCLFAAAITYAMASNIIIIGTIFGERLIYLPSAFLLILAAMVLARLPAKLAATILTFLLLLGFARSYTYAIQWHDRDSFYAYSLRHQPNSARLHLLLAEVDRQEGRLDDARSLLLDGRRMLPDYWQFWYDGGLVEEDAKNWPEASADFQRAFDLHPSNALEDRVSHAQRMMLQAATRGSN
ncbi:MAG: hypothetical protein ABSF29_07150 [Tepidisphaeraceae bacterium]|jgi:hypothetical protein